jgi:hypothetical protein
MRSCRSAGRIGQKKYDLLLVEMLNYNARSLVTLSRRFVLSGVSVMNHELYDSTSAMTMTSTGVEDHLMRRARRWQQALLS